MDRPPAWRCTPTSAVRAPTLPCLCLQCETQTLTLPLSFQSLVTCCRAPDARPDQLRQRRDDTPTPQTPHPRRLSWAPHSPTALKASVTWWLALAEVSMNSKRWLSANSWPS